MESQSTTVQEESVSPTLVMTDSASQLIDVSDNFVDENITQHKPIGPICTPGIYEFSLLTLEDDPSYVHCALYECFILINCVHIYITNRTLCGVYCAVGIGTGGRYTA